MYVCWVVLDEKSQGKCLKGFLKYGRKCPHKRPGYDAVDHFANFVFHRDGQPQLGQAMHRADITVQEFAFYDSDTGGSDNELIHADINVIVSPALAGGVVGGRRGGVVR